MRAKRSLVQIYLISLVALSAIPLAVLGYIWIAKEYESYTQQSQEWRDSYIESRRELLRREVDKAVEYLEFRRNQLNRHLYLELRQQIAIGLSLAFIVSAFIFGNQRPDSEKMTAYECGFDAFDDSRRQFDVRFYLVAILFIIFDLEIAFLFP